MKYKAERGAIQNIAVALREHPLTIGFLILTLFIFHKPKK